MAPDPISRATEIVHVDPSERISAPLARGAADGRQRARSAAIVIAIVVAHLGLVLELARLDAMPAIVAQKTQEIPIELVAEPPSGQKTQADQKKSDKPKMAAAAPALAKIAPAKISSAKISPAKPGSPGLKAAAKTEPMSPPITPTPPTVKPQTKQEAKPEPKQQPMPEPPKPPALPSAPKPAAEAKPAIAPKPAEEKKPPAGEMKPLALKPPVAAAVPPVPADRPKPPVQQPALPAPAPQLPPMSKTFHAVAVPSPTQDGDLVLAYKTLVFSKLELAKRFPKEARKRHAHGSAIIAFALDDKGHVTRVTLLESSGDTALDGASLALVERAAPFPPPPPGAKKDFAAIIEFADGK